jgi:hypothetical protein
MTVQYPAATSASQTTIHFGRAVTTAPNVARDGLPGTIPSDQLFFWTRQWQEGEAESAAARAAGDVREFASGREATRWLLSDDE